MAKNTTTEETPVTEVEAASVQTTYQIEAARPADKIPYEIALSELELREAELNKREAELAEREAVLSLEPTSNLTRAQLKAQRELLAMQNDSKKRADLKDVVTPTPVYRHTEEKE